MRVALISDVHANLPALEAVLAEAERAGAEAVWSMGDQVGYGAEPDAVVARLRAAGAVCVLGNHDAAVAGIIGTEEFNPLAAQAVRWTAANASPDTVAWLRSLPPTVQSEGWARAHGTLRDPMWEYLATGRAAAGHFAAQTTQWSAVGHTHVPMVLWEEREGFDLAAPGGRSNRGAGRTAGVCEPGQRRAAARWGLAGMLGAPRHRRGRRAVPSRGVRHRGCAGAHPGGGAAGGVGGAARSREIRERRREKRGARRAMCARGRWSATGSGGWTNGEIAELLWVSSGRRSGT
ncbi:MAG: metallophosphoesterase [Thermoflexaceae bacterium]|nr:metallophosphoesterase [Thermoflexaceae bacterium]